MLVGVGLVLGENVSQCFGNLSCVHIMHATSTILENPQISDMMQC